MAANGYFGATYFEKSYFWASYFPGGLFAPRVVLCPPFTLDVATPLRATLRAEHVAAELEVGCKP